MPETAFGELPDKSWRRINDRPRSFGRYTHGFQEMPLETKTCYYLAIIAINGQWRVNLITW